MEGGLVDVVVDCFSPAASFGKPSIWLCYKQQQQQQQQQFCLRAWKLYSPKVKVCYRRVALRVLRTVADRLVRETDR